MFGELCQCLANYANKKRIDTKIFVINNMLADYTYLHSLTTASFPSLYF